jgi:hypothetical protein
VYCLIAGITEPPLRSLLPPSTPSSAAGDSPSRARPRPLWTTRGASNPSHNFGGAQDAANNTQTGIGMGLVESFMQYALRVRFLHSIFSHYTILKMRYLIVIRAAMHATFTLPRMTNELELQTMHSKLQSIRKLLRMHRPTSS